MAADPGILELQSGQLRRVQEARIRVLLADPDPVSERVIRSVLAQDSEITLDQITPSELCTVLCDFSADIVVVEGSQIPKQKIETMLDSETSGARAFIITTYNRLEVAQHSSPAIDVLEKPFDFETFRESLDAAKSHIYASTYMTRYPRTEQPSRRDEIAEPVVSPVSDASQILHRLAVEVGETIVLIRAEEVEWVQSFGNNCRLHVGTNSHILRQNLTKLLAVLDPGRFLRVHRSAIVNLDHVEEFHLPATGNMYVKLRSGTCLPLRRSSRTLLRKVLTKGHPKPSKE